MWSKNALNCKLQINRIVPYQVIPKFLLFLKFNNMFVKCSSHRSFMLPVFRIIWLSYVDGKQVMLNNDNINVKFMQTIPQKRKRFFKSATFWGLRFIIEFQSSIPLYTKTQELNSVFTKRDVWGVLM